MKAELDRQLRGDEDVEPFVYVDSLGYYTIAVGRLVDKRKAGAGLRPDEISYLLQNDINDRINALHAKLPWFDALDDARKGVLLNMAFQLGVDGLLGFVHALQLVKDGKYENAAAAMLESRWAEETPDRAKRLSVQMRTGLWQYAPNT